MDATGNITRFVLNIASYPNKANPQKLIAKIRELSGITCDISINPKGDWNKCFGFADSGLTGRKLACDTQCGLFSNGGGAWFGKDTSKADYSIPLYLTLCARKIGNTELTASTIIGDTKVYIYDITGKLIEETQYSEIMKFANTVNVDILGGLK
jgi:hypothetical protein